MMNRTLVISQVNKEQAQENGMLRLFIRSLQEGEGTEFLIKHILFVTVDEIAFKQCSILKLNCYQLPSMEPLNSSEEMVLSGGLDMMWGRSLLLGEVLRHGYSFIFTDLDVMWLRNPFPMLSYAGEDMQIYNGEPNNSSHFFFISGFYSVAANNKTIALFDQLYAARIDSKIVNGKDMLMFLLRSISRDALQRLGLKVHFLDAVYFSGLSQEAIDITKVTTVHADCCPSEEAKLADLTVLVDAWKTYHRKSNVTLLVGNACTQSMNGAAMANKTVIISVLNKAYVEKNGMLDLFLRSLGEGKDTGLLIKHLVLVAVDKTAFDRCSALGLHCYQLVTDGIDFSKEVLYMSDDFIKMMWSRTLFLGNVLRRGYNFIFTDMDVMWLRNPFSHLHHQGEDLEISCDRYNGQPYDQSNSINTGFYFVASNNKTIALFDEWYAASHTSKGMKEQDVLYRMKSQGAFRRLGIKVRFLDTAYFSGFCEDSRDSRRVTTVHANCCRSIKAKLTDLKRVLEMWKTHNGTSFRWPPHTACAHSWG
ncbi:hypothetical protein BHE74_00047933 [Ensete ventricosum]|uniref:Uncharacterized protein n=1 Tax=Ensete ventricosum TaxID=4639 RepID=A0A444FEH5_ENSVE|nr:hypothetical protein GW17_00014805 [Ensete ventricosum]RWW46160.1 hypothetical protein BHE74_00047933 [Ensete ventricosum]RZR74794.1 hypothetical protein BHM03_00043718 [Ensete ventricosum]